MKKILICNQKGGVGKSTLSDLLAFSLEKKGYSVALANIDNQHDLSFPSRESSPNDDFQIIDTPGFLNESFSSWCNEADYVLMPTLASEFDRVDLLRCHELASEACPNVGVVLNCYDKRGTIDRDFLSYLTDNLEYDVIAKLPRAVAVRKAQIAGVSLYEFDKKCPVLTEIDKLAVILVNRLGGDYNG